MRRSTLFGLFVFLGSWSAQAEVPCHLDSMSAETVIKIPVNLVIDAGSSGYYVAPMKSFKNKMQLKFERTDGTSESGLVSESGFSYCAINFQKSSVTQTMRGILRFKVAGWSSDHSMNKIAYDFQTPTLEGESQLTASETKLNTRPVKVTLHCQNSVSVEGSFLDDFFDRIAKLKEIAAQRRNIGQSNSAEEFERESLNKIEISLKRRWIHHPERCLYRTLVESLQNSNLGDGPGSIEFDDRPFNR